MAVPPRDFALWTLLKIHPVADYALWSMQPQHTSIGEVAAMAQRLPAPDGNGGTEGGDGQLIHLVLHPPRTSAAATAAGTTSAVLHQYRPQTSLQPMLLCLCCALYSFSDADRL